MDDTDLNLGVSTMNESIETYDWDEEYYEESYYDDEEPDGGDLIPTIG